MDSDERVPLYPSHRKELKLGEISYKCRPSLLSTEVTWTLTDHAIESSTGLRLPFTDIATIHLHSIGKGVLRCLIKPVHGRAISLLDRHYVSLGLFEDRSDTFLPLIRLLLRRVAAANPAARLLDGMTFPLWLLWSASLLFLLMVIIAAAMIFAVGFVKGADFWLGALMTFLIIAFLALPTFWISRFLWHAKARPMRLE